MRRLLLTMTVISLAIGGVQPAEGQRSALEGRQGDLAIFKRDIFGRDSSYAPAARAEAIRRLAKLESELATVTAAYFELELARIVALADNGHSNAPASLRSTRYARIPVRFVPLGDEFYVLRADTAHADLLGARLVAVDGKPLRDVRAAGHTLVGGTPAWRDRFLPFFIESTDQMKALGLIDNADAATYRLELRNGRTVDRRIVARPPDARREFWGTSRWLYPDPLDADSGAWKHVAPRDRAPWAFQELGAPFRLRAAPELDAVVVQLRANNDTRGHSIATFLAEAIDEIRRVRPHNVVLDLRSNGGGDLNTTRTFAQALPNLVSGRIFVLTSPWTFSAAISTTGYLKQAGKERVTIVGEMLGDRQEFWAEGRETRLPYSGAVISYSTQRHDYRNGCRSFTDCHGSVVRNPISVSTFVPNIHAPITLESLMAGRDPAMDAIAKALRGIS